MFSLALALRPAGELELASLVRSRSWNKYTQIASRAVRTALSESERVAAEKRATIGV